jgi:hypothetical protein
MKKVAFAFGLFLFLSGAAVNSHAQIIVKIRPAEPTVVETRPVAPYRDAVWIGPEWRVQHGAYVRVPGHWVKPRRGWRWGPGHWEDRRGGSIWIRGGWVR